MFLYVSHYLLGWECIHIYRYISRVEASILHYVFSKLFHPICWGKDSHINPDLIDRLMVYILWNSKHVKEIRRWSNSQILMMRRVFILEYMEAQTSEALWNCFYAHSLEYGSAGTTTIPVWIVRLLCFHWLASPSHWLKLFAWMHLLCICCICYISYVHINFPSQIDQESINVTS